jgi:pyruvate-ferredoxin/flavodoxin oxidoreductase
MADGSVGPLALTGAMPTTVPFPGTPTIIDGSEAVASVETRISEGCCAYPITPSTTMAAIYQAAVADGRTNLWGTPLRFLEPESEHSSASAAEGFALAGGRVTNFTAGQGLVLMKEVLHVISGKRLPVVFHVGARALTSQALNIHAGHDDVMAVADIGWGILFARNAQEAADLAAIARRVAEASQTPFLVCQDGFLTTHTLENVHLPEDELLRDFVGDPRLHIRDLFDPAEALMTGVVQNQDSYMKGKIGQRAFTGLIPDAFREAADAWGVLTGRRYAPIDAYHTEDAQTILVAMGTIADTAVGVVDQLRARGRRVGLVGITSFRPFPAEDLVAALGGASAVAVVERTDEPLAAHNPLTREVRAALLARAEQGLPVPQVVSASAGLGSRDVAAGDLAAVFTWASDPEARRERPFAVLGIRHELGLVPEQVEVRPAGSWSVRGHSVGGFGSVTTNKLVATLCGDLFGLQVQAYPRYGSEKKGLPTTYYLTIADAPIRQHAELAQVEFVPVHDASAFLFARPLDGLVDGGTVFLNSGLPTPEGIWASLPVAARSEIVARGIRVVALDTAELARRHAPRPDLLVRMQGIALVGVFLRVAPFAAERSSDELFGALRAVLARYFGKRGGKVVDANLALIRDAWESLLDVTAAVAASSQAATAASRLVPVEEELRGEASGTGASSRGVVEVQR